jgi:hypothetical protein
MATIYTKKFNWLPRRSAWESMQNWREKQRAHKERADTFAATAEAFGATIVNLGSGITELAVRQASTRIDAAVQSKLSSFNALV